MFDKLDDLILRYEEVMNLLSEPDVANDTNRFRNLMKEQANLAPIVDAYKNTRHAKRRLTILLPCWRRSDKKAVIC